MEPTHARHTNLEAEAKEELLSRAIWGYFIFSTLAIVMLLVTILFYPGCVAH